MKNNGQSRVLRNIVSPYGLATISYAIFLCSCLLPPAFYTRYVHEPDLMFLDPVTIFFYTLCLAGFLAGLWLIDWLLVPPATPVNTKLFSKSPAVLLLIPLTLCALFTAYSIVLILRNNPLAISILMSQNGNFIANGSDAALEMHGTMNISVLFVSGVVWWSVWRYHQFGTAWRGKLLVRFAQVLAAVAVFLFTSLVLSKHLVTVLFTGLAVCYLVRKNLLKQLNWNLVAKTILLFAVGGSLVFFFVSFLKGASDPDTQISTFIGYSVAPYNRFAALLHGQLHFEYSGRGIYFSSFLSFNNLINKFIPFRKTLDLPDFDNWWWSVFNSVGRAGLNSSLIFCGAFGELFVEIKWLTPVYLVFYGLLYGLAWRWILAGRLIGIVLYPYCAYCILFWFTTNGLFDQDIVTLTIDVILLAAYEFLFVSPARERSPVFQIA